LGLWEKYSVENETQAFCRCVNANAEGMKSGEWMNRENRSPVFL
jgi:hypothetical protein